jgi:hypothetical protein
MLPRVVDVPVVDEVLDVVDEVPDDVEGVADVLDDEETEPDGVGVSLPPHAVADRSRTTAPATADAARARMRPP